MEDVDNAFPNFPYSSVCVFFFLQRRSLRAANAKLKEENENVNRTLQSTISSLQSQMNVALTTALRKKTELESKLAEAERAIQDLLKKKTCDCCNEI